MWGDNFFSWRREMTTAFQSIESSAELYQLLQRQICNMGFDYYAFCVRHPVPFTRPKFTVKSTYPLRWIEHYRAENYSAIDPLLMHQNVECGFLVWDDELFSESRELWLAAQRFGLRQGFTQCTIIPNRAMTSLSVANNSLIPREYPQDELSVILQHLLEWSSMHLMRMSDPAMESRPMKLSKREREILQWTGEGKTAGEIAMILSISENTVNFHQKNMQKKFSAPNKTQIACYAAAIGLI